MSGFLLAIALAVPLASQAPAAVTGVQEPGAPPTAAQPQPAADPDQQGEALVTAGADVLASSAFVWRGFVDGDSMVVQPDVWVKVRGVTVSSWMNVARHSPENKPFTEHDLTVDYSFSRGRVTMCAGWTNYAFLDQDSDRISNEFYAGIARDGLLSPSLRIYQDVQQGSGTYVSVAVQQAFTLPAGVLVVPNASLGYNRRLYTAYSAFSDAVTGLKVTIPTPLKTLSVQPFVAYSFSLDHRITTDRFYWGVGASIATR